MAGRSRPGNCSKARGLGIEPSNRQLSAIGREHLQGLALGLHPARVFSFAPVTLGVIVLRLTLERKRRGWSQTELAERVVAELGVVGFCSRLRRQDIISQVELGRLTPTDAELAALARALQITPAFVLLVSVDVTVPDPADQVPS